MDYLIPIIIISAFAHCWSDAKGKNILSIIFKPLTMVLIMYIILGEGIPVERYGRFILMGLIFSLIGDMMLLKPWYKFQIGLASFLIGHIFYIAAFTGARGQSWDYLPLLPFIGFGIWLYRNIEPNLSKVKIPVIIYMVVIITMVWRGMGIWLGDASPFGVCVGVGSFIFCVSDYLLAYQRFNKAIPYGNTLVLATYYLAQYLLARSVIL